MTTSNFVYLFSEGNKNMKSLLGGKGANLAEMVRIGLPVPPGFIVTTEACNQYLLERKGINSKLREEICNSLKLLEKETGRELGGLKPLLLSVRSGAVTSMPGMMDTILNLGLNSNTVQSLSQETGDKRFALDCFRRFIQMYSEVVLKLDHYAFENVLSEARQKKGFKSDSELSENDLNLVIDQFMEFVRRETGKDFPEDPYDQLFMAVEAVFNSWNSERAIVYRKAHRIPENLGTAVNIQAMVFGNLSNDSGTGVAFTRSPVDGVPELYGEYLLNAQGEDVVAGIRTPRPISEMSRDMPEVYQEFLDACNLLEKHYHDMQDIEFTIEQGKLYILQTRTGKRTAEAAVRIAVDLVSEGFISKTEALLKVDPAQLEQMMHWRIDPNALLDAVARGLPASPGAATGKAIFCADRANELSQEGIDVLLVRPETTPEDIQGIIAARGILTSRGGMTSHAAVVARGMGKPCVCGCEDLKIDLKKRCFYIGDREFQEGEELSIDGVTGQVFIGKAPLIEPQFSEHFYELIGWADEVRRLKVRANADNPKDARLAVDMGAQGIGLCRTEHMFMASDRVPVVQKMILSSNMLEREKALQELLPMQKNDFAGILKEMSGKPVTIRLLDPPLHEFLPGRDDLLLEVEQLRRDNGNSELLLEKERLLEKVQALSEVNPMLGHRGCRLGLVYPEIYRMQIEAIFRAVFQLIDEGMDKELIQPEIMIPLVGHHEEMKRMKKLIDDTASELMEDKGVKVEYMVGTMIELPRACLVADYLAQDAQFFSFGTNDLTQTTLGYSRDDSEGKFLPFYLQNKVLNENPFTEVDREGVGQLIEIAIQKGRETRPDLKIGICGEHGGDPESIEYFDHIGLDYISCSPYRLPIARLAAAKTTIMKQNK